MTVSTIQGGSFYVDGEHLLNLEEDSQFALEDLEVGEHDLGMIYADGTKEKQTVQIQKNEKHIISFARPLEKLFGSLTVKVQFFSKPRLEFLIGRENFLPPPKVDSATVSFVPVERRKLPCNGNWRDFFEFIEVICRHRRKSLKTILRMSGLCGVLKANIQRLLEQVHIEPNLRPESLSLENYIALYEAIRQQRQESLQSP